MYISVCSYAEESNKERELFSEWKFYCPVFVQTLRAVAQLTRLSRSNCSGQIQCFRKVIFKCVESGRNWSLHVITASYRIRRLETVPRDAKNCCLLGRDPALREEFLRHAYRYPSRSFRE